MFAINHAATALLIKRQYPNVPMVWLLLPVQAMELLRVILNYAGVEQTTTEPIVHGGRHTFGLHAVFSFDLLSPYILFIGMGNFGERLAETDSRSGGWAWRLVTFDLRPTDTCG